MNKEVRKVLRLAYNDRLDDAVYLWFTQKRSQDMLVSGPVLCEKAAQLHEQLHEGESVPPFQASRGWLWHFGQRHGIRQLSLQGEKVFEVKKVKDMLDKCLLWYERQEECTSTSLLLLKLVRDLAATKRFLKLKQLKLDSFLAHSQ